MRIFQNTPARCVVRSFLVALFLNLWVCPLNGQEEEQAFKPGIAIPEFGKVADVKSDVEIPANTVLKLRFDVSRQAGKDQINRTLDSAARLINIHVATGAKEDSLEVAVVLHGDALMDVVSKEFYETRYSGRKHGSIQAVHILQRHHVKVYVCGQSAAHHGVAKEDLLPGVKIAPSAMTAHAILGSQGFSLNPF